MCKGGDFLKMKMSVLLMLSVLMLSVSVVSATVVPAIVLSPNEGVSAFVVSGSGFKPCRAITCYWDGSVVPVVGSSHVGSDGSFTVLMAVQDQGVSGVYNVTVEDSCGRVATAFFTVLDMTGPQGDVGPQGDGGERGTQGIQGPMGFNGTDGTNGTEGLRGPPGFNGLIGPTGPPGEMGPPGETGERGLQGVAGVDSVVTLPNTLSSMWIPLIALAVAVLALLISIVNSPRKNQKQ